MTPSAPIILYDGVCGFCNQTVQFILKYDRAEVFRFAPLQSKSAEELLRSHPELPRDLDSVILIDQGRGFARTDAVLHIAAQLGWPWNLAQVGWLVPRFARNALYDAFARRRYRWFGKLDACPLPTLETRQRFIDS